MVMCFFGGGNGQLQEMIDEADRDGDGEVNEEEFLRIMKTLGGTVVLCGHLPRFKLVGKLFGCFSK